jgi:putative ABC transport system permease protein
VVLSNSFWRTKFHADPNIIGKTFDMEGSVATIVGVMPQGVAGMSGERLDMWLPIDPKSSRFADRIDHWLTAVGRLKPGVTIQQAQSEMNVVAEGIATAYPKTNKGVGEKLEPLQETMRSGADFLYPLLGAVAFILLIGCLNVANLLQSRTESRRREYALRLALGADRSRLMQQTMVESMVIAALGCLAGIALAFAGLKILLFMADSRYISDVAHINGRVLLFTIVVSALTAFVFGIVPAFQASRTDPNAALREGERGGVGKSRGLVRQSLAVAEIALAMVLLVGAGLMIDSVFRLKTVNPGFDSRNVLTAEVVLPEGGKYIEHVPGDKEKSSPSVDDFYRRLLLKYSAIPGVETATAAGVQPGAMNRGTTFAVLGRPAPPDNDRPVAGIGEVRPGYFDMFRIQLRSGRLIDEHDAASTPWVVVINEALAKKYFPNEDPIGKQIRLRFDPYPVDEDRPRQIVGVVRDTRNRSLSRDPFPYIYIASDQQQAIMPGGVMATHIGQTLMLKLKSSDKGIESQVIATMRQGINEVDPNIPLLEPMLLDDVLDLFIGDYFLYRNILAIFAGIALLLAVIGIYGVMSYFVSARTHEIGVRVALGALPRDILELIGGLGLKLSSIGVIVGAALAFGLTRLISTFLYGVKPSDPISYVIVAFVLTAIALLACFIPARRAVKVDPMIALRHE